MTHDSSVNFKLIHVLLGTEGSHQSCNFDTFGCSAENLPNSSCHFTNHKSVFLWIIHHSSVSWKITPLYFFRPSINTLHKRNQSKCKFLRLLGARVKFTKFFSWLKQQISFFFKLCITLHCHETYFLCTFLAEMLYAFNKMSPSKYKFGEILREQSKVWKFALWWAPYPNHVQFQLKKYKRVISDDSEEWFKV